MSKLELSERYSECPTAWKNFIKHLQGQDRGSVRHSLISETLHRYNMVDMELYGVNPWVEFETEEDITAFLLMWA